MKDLHGESKQHIVTAVSTNQRFQQPQVLVYQSSRRKYDQHVSLITMCWKKKFSIKSDHDVLESKV
jgi:hypothetical protein